MKARSIHMQFTHVHGSDTRHAVASASAYIAGAGQDNATSADTSIEKTLNYLRATGRHRPNQGRVAATVFLCRGNLERKQVWHELDQSFRTKIGEYSRRGGNKCRKGDEIRTSGSPRLAMFMDATFPHELTEIQKIEIGLKLAEAHVERYGCAVDVAWHLKNDVIDHVHFLITSRVVDEDGVGPIIREFNGVASKCSDDVVRDGKKRLAGHAEWARQEFASMLTQATNIKFDARSFKRQGSIDKPVPWITREQLEREAADRTNTALHERKRLLAARAAHERGIREDREITAVPAPWQPMDAAAHAGSIEPKLPSAAILYPSSQPPKSALPTSFVAPSLAHIRDDEIRAKLMREQVDRECRAEARAWTDEQRDLDVINSRRLAELDRQQEEKRSRRDDNEHQIVHGTPAPIAPVPEPTARIAPHASTPIQPTWMFAYDEDEENEKKKGQRRSGKSSDLQAEKKPPPPVDPNIRGLQKRAPEPRTKTPLPAFSTEEGELVGTLPITPRPQAREDNTIGIVPSKAVPSPHSPAMSKQDVRKTAIALGTLCLKCTPGYGPVERLASISSLEIVAFKDEVVKQMPAWQTINDTKLFDYVSRLLARCNDKDLLKIGSIVLPKIEARIRLKTGQIAGTSPSTYKPKIYRRTLAAIEKEDNGR